MTYNTLLYEKSEAIAQITFNVPEKMNALSTMLVDEFNDVLDRIFEDQSIVVVLITGRGKAFMAGADLKEIEHNSPEQNAIYNRRLIDTFNRVQNSSIPFIAVINGYAFGGGLELALACDIRMASENAKMGLPEVKLGILPGAGGTQRLPRLISRGAALRLMLTGETITAFEAAKLGIIDSITKVVDLEDSALKLAKQISSNAPLAVKAVTDAVNVGLELPLQEALAYTEKNLDLLNRTIDAKEGNRAFLEKRQPVFKGI